MTAVPYGLPPEPDDSRRSNPWNEPWPRIYESKRAVDAMNEATVEYAKVSESWRVYHEKVRRSRRIYLRRVGWAVVAWWTTNAIVWIVKGWRYK